MLQEGIRGWLLLALIPHAAAIAAVPATPSDGPTVEEVETLIESMMSTVWNLSTPQQDDESSRGAAADVERFVLSDATLKQIESIRATLPGSVDPATGRIPLGALAPLEQIMLAEACKLSAVMGHWSRGSSLNSDMDGALGRLPAARRAAFEKEIDGVIATLNTSRAQLDADVKECASLEPGQTSAQSVRVDAAMQALSQVRRNVAAEVDMAVRDGEVQIVWQARTSPCPAPRSPNPGTSRPQLARQGGSDQFYPPLAQSLGIEATVRVRIDIDEGGCVVAAGVLATSASDMLDEAAVRRALDQEYIPAGTDGKASRFSAVLPVTFSLRMREGPAGNRAQPQP